jgi:tRNA pseudouridine55 synthase
MAAPDGLLVVDKPAGWSSHDVVARCRRLAGTRRVGHAGTLDPMATGVLVLGIGRATRLLGYLALSSKCYAATVRLGQTTLTDDAEGEIIHRVDASRLSDEAVAAAVSTYTGELQQVPSAVSAVKVRGRRAYARVRSGEYVELAPRTVRVTSFTVLAVRRSQGLVDVDVRVECSTGTYVRALARDLGAELGVGGHLSALRRLRVGSYGIERAYALNDLESFESADLPIIGLDEAARQNFASYVVDDEHVQAIRNGRVLDLQLCRPPEQPAGPVAVLAPGGRLLALYKQDGPVARPAAVFDPA